MNFGPNPNQQNPRGFQENPRYQQYTGGQQPPADKRSRGMTAAAIILSVTTLSTVCCIYVSFVCSILSIIFALLSKGGESTISSNARAALLISVLAVVITISLTASSIALVVMQYGSLEGFMQEYMKILEGV